MYFLRPRGIAGYFHSLHWTNCTEASTALSRSLEIIPTSFCFFCKLDWSRRVLWCPSAAERTVRVLCRTHSS